jgi:hypothetical protein
VAAYTVDDPNWGGEYANVSECMVRDAWKLPGIDQTIRDNWETLINPATTYEQAGAILGVGVPQGVDENGVLEQGCP